jgi:polyisoprenoid-binding protein YceI
MPQTKETCTVGAPPPPGRYLVDPRRTVVRFTIRKLGLFRVHGSFTRMSGTLDVPDAVRGSRLAAAIEALSFTTRNPRRDRVEAELVPAPTP